MSDNVSPSTQTKSGCFWLIVMLFGTMFVAYLAVRLIFWLIGEPMPV